MSKYSLTLTPRAIKSISKLSQKDQARVQATLLLLSDNPFPPSVKKLHGREGYRVRVGDIRIFYSVDDGMLIILVLDLGHRREVYR